jgi:hypothetical protein
MARAGGETVSDWKDALAPEPECIALDRLDGELDAAQRAHVASCVRCQTELALFREVMQEERSEESEWIARELRRRRNVVAFRAKTTRILYAVAAAIVLVIGLGWWMQMREPSIEAPLGGQDYRSGRLEVLAPAGDLLQAPNELRWTAVPSTSRYHVRILEVDATEVWSGDTTETHVALPPNVIEQFAPGKSLKWDVQAFRGKQMLASSETQTVRVSVEPLRKNP